MGKTRSKRHGQLGSSEDLYVFKEPAAKPRRDCSRSQVVQITPTVAVEITFDPTRRTHSARGHESSSRLDVIDAIIADLFEKYPAEEVLGGVRLGRQGGTESPDGN
jgi:hypothetical protein